MTARLDVDALVVGGGPAGLAAATALRSSGVARVLVVEREPSAGGVPRHCHHSGFGLRDLHRVLGGPEYAERLVSRALVAGVDLRTSSMVTGWGPDGEALVTSPAGRLSVTARAVILATGARERPRSARLVPGDRAAGVLTTGALQQMVAAGLPVGSRALVVGAEHVSYSAVLTLRHAGVTPVAMVTDLPRPQSLRAFDAVTRLGFGVPVWTSTRVAAIHGRGRVAGVDLAPIGGSGGTRTVAVDTVVFTGDWIPDHELARRAGAVIDAGTRGPAVDAAGATTVPGVFAAGNLVHPVETADVAAVRGAAAGRSVGEWLRCQSTAAGAGAAVTVEAPLLWVSPNRVRDRGRAAAQPVLLRSAAWLSRPEVRVVQDGRLLGEYRPHRMVPNRSVSIPGSCLASADPEGGPVVIGVAGVRAPLRSLR